MADDEVSGGIFADNPWLLIPLTALMIPIIAVITETDAVALQIALGLVVLVIAAAVAARGLMTHRHGLRMAELEAQARLAEADSEQLAQANRIIDQNAKIAELRSALTAQESQTERAREFDS